MHCWRQHKFQALPKSSTLLNEEQINFDSRENWSGSLTAVKHWVDKQLKQRATQAGILAYVGTSCSSDFVSWLGRIVTHYEYAFTSEQGTSSEILMRDGVKSRPGQDDYIGIPCIREHSIIHEKFVSPNETNWSPYWDLKSRPSDTSQTLLPLSYAHTSAEEWNIGY